MALAVVTLTNAIADSDLVLTLSSTTGMSSGPSTQTVLAIDNEQMAVVDVISSTQVKVNRAQNSTKPQGHGASRAVYWGIGPDFTQVGPWYQPGAANPQSMSGPTINTTTPVTIDTATAVTLTAGQILNGLILQDPNGGAVTTTLPTAALLVAAIPGLMIGSTIRYVIRNTANANETITVASGTGGTDSGTMTIGQNNQKEFLIRFTAVAEGSEAYTNYSMGTVVF